jgi:recombination protein RecR
MSIDPIDRLTQELSRLPGIGMRSAARLALYIVQRSAEGSSLARDLMSALSDAREKVRRCRRCENLSTDELCGICADSRRDATVVCIVEQVQDLRAIEATGAFKGLYHVLHGALSPLEGIGPAQLHLDRLEARLKTDSLREIVIATNATVEGDATALYIAQIARPLDIPVSRLAAGIPLGGEIEYVDTATLGRAIRERREL